MIDDLISKKEIIIINRRGINHLFRRDRFGKAARDWCEGGSD